MCLDFTLNIMSKILEKRWEKGTPHHSKAEDLVDEMNKRFNRQGDYDHILKKGGDGDPGEDLLLMLSEIFDELDRLNIQL